MSIRIFLNLLSPYRAIVFLLHLQPANANMAELRESAAWPKTLDAVDVCFKTRLYEAAKAKLPAWYVQLCNQQGRLKTTEEIVKAIADK